jgi:adenosylmethionine---8-amino-7-oxononanoate aminotransferase
LDLSSIDKQIVWHPYTQMQDWQVTRNPVIVSGEGFYLVDKNRRKYLDGIASMWCNVWGQGKREIVNAMIKQLNLLQHSTLFGLANQPSIVLAKKLVKLATGMDKVFFSDNGSTAVEAAMKMAVQYWHNKGKTNKTKFISLENGYHGDTLGCMSLGYLKKFFQPYKGLLFRAYRVPSPLLYGSGYQHTERLMEYCLEQTEKALIKYNSKCAALIMESGAQIAGGIIIYPKDFQRKISQLCKKYDVLLILDEIATGFGRLGNMVQYIAENSFPDIVCFGKALTAGYFPLAVTLTTQKIFDAFLGDYAASKHFYHGHTFTGHPVGCATAIANLDLYKKAKLIKQIRDNSDYLRRRLQEFKELPIVEDIRHKGLLAGIELAKNGRPISVMKNKRRINYFIMQESLKMGIFLRPLGNIMLVIPPLAIDRTNLEKLLEVHLRILKKIEKEA